VSILYSVELHMHKITSAPFHLKAKGGLYTNFMLRYSTLHIEHCKYHCWQENRLPPTNNLHILKYIAIQRQQHSEAILILAL